MDEIINRLENINTVILQNNLIEIKNLISEDMTGGGDFADFEKKLPEILEYLSQNIKKREKTYSKKVKKLNSQLSKYVNDMTQFINERENNGDKERETFLNIISAVKDDLSSVIFGSGDTQSITDVLGKAVENIPGLETRDNPMNQLNVNDLNKSQGGGGDKNIKSFLPCKVDEKGNEICTEETKQDLKMSKEVLDEVGNYFDPKYDNYVNLLDEKNEFYENLKNYVIDGPVKPYDRMLVDLLKIEKEEDAELEKLKEIFQILLLAVYKSENFKRYKNLSFDELFLQNEDPFPHGVLDCKLSENGISFEKALDRIQDVPGYCNLFFPTDDTLKRHYLKQIHRIIYIKQHLEGKFPKLKLMSGWIVGDKYYDRLQAGGNNSDDDDEILNIESVLNPPGMKPLTVNQVKNDNTQNVNIISNDEVQGLDPVNVESKLDNNSVSQTGASESSDKEKESKSIDKELESKIDKLFDKAFKDRTEQIRSLINEQVDERTGTKKSRLSENVGPSIGDEDIQFVNPGAVLVNKRLQKMENLQKELYKMIEGKKEKEKGNDNESKTTYDKKQATVVDINREKKDNIEKQRKLEDLFEEFMEENALIMNAQIRMLNDVQSSVGVVKQRRDYDQDKINSALDRLRRFAVGLKVDDDDEDDDDDDDNLDE